MTHVIKRHGLGRVLDQIGDVVHGVDQRVDLLTVQRRDEGLVQGLVHLVCHTVGRTFGVVHILVVFLAQVGIVVVFHQLRERMCRGDDVVGVLVEHFKKITFAWQQLAK
ncbi:hypothetical protein D3C86_1618900 [compost metagenome]